MGMDLKQEAMNNSNRLRGNSYPGRGIVLGASPDGSKLVQIYWIMGRSENSRNRIFIVEDNGNVRTAAHNPALLTDPSLIIYYPARSLDRCHIVSNGDQTEDIFLAMQKGKDFENALQMREFEPDAPHFTPRISGIMDMMENRTAYRLSILKSHNGDVNLGCQRHFFTYEKAIPGIGHCIHTYASDGNPLPSFAGEPYAVQIQESAELCANFYWDLLDSNNRVSLFVKWIDRLTFESKVVVINRNA